MEVNFAVIAGISMGTMLAPLVGFYMWVNRTKVSKETCLIVRQNDRNEHAQLTNYIAAAEKRAEERFKELKEDLRDIKTSVNGKVK